MVSLDGTPGGAVSVTEPLPPPIGRSTLVSISVMGPTDSSGEILISANEESTSMTAWIRAIAPSLSQTYINSPEDLMPSIVNGSLRLLPPPTRLSNPPTNGIPSADNSADKRTSTVADVVPLPHHPNTYR